jgi:hypothetical protein
MTNGWKSFKRNTLMTHQRKKEEGLKFTRANMIRAIRARCKTTIQDFTPTNPNGIFRHWYSFSFVVENDKGDGNKKKKMTYLYATKPGQDYPRKLRVAQVFIGEVEMDNCMRGLKKRNRAEDEANETISATTNHQALIDYYDTRLE